MENLTNRELFDATIRSQITLERVKLDLVRKVRADLRKLYSKQIPDTIRNLSIDKLDELTPKELRKILADIDLLQKRALANLESFSQDVHQNIIKVNLAQEAASLGKVIGELGSLKRQALDTVLATVLATPINATGELVEEMLDNWTDAKIRTANNTLRQAWHEGWTVQQTTRAFRGTRANRFRDGIAEINSRHAEAVVRTTTQHIASSTRTAFFAENSDIIRGHKWVSTLDSRTSHICQNLDGEEFPLDGRRPPAHINCRSTIIPLLRKDLERKVAPLRDGATRSSSSGPIRADITYFEWLKTQANEVQEEVLGKARAQLFREGGVTAEEFKKLNTTRSMKPKNLETLTKEILEG